MKKFMDKDFLLQSDAACELYHEHAEKMPIFDFHCHLIPSEISSNRRFDNISDIWLGGDHYKWRQMRSNGLTEINSDKWLKFLDWAKTLEFCIGNPLFHWTHLELQRYFGIYDILNEKNAKKIYDECNRLLQTDPSLSVFGIFKKFNVYGVVTTDDPVDDLAEHKKVAAEGGTDTLVKPAFRPDKALNIDKAGFAEYIKKLSEVSGIEIKTAEDALEALIKRLDYFVSCGCVVTDHALLTSVYEEATVDEVNSIFAKAYAGECVNALEAEKYRTYMLCGLGREYAKKGLVMQLHMGSIRDNNSERFAALGPDTGYDAVLDLPMAEKLSKFLDSMEKTGSLPKTILYTLNPKDYYSLGTLMGCFQGKGVPGKIQLGSAWWFCDHKDGMEQQMKVLGNLGLLARFVGMLTDSRSFLSYPRHEYFRRILCNILGGWVENGELPNDMEWLGGIVENISFNNAKNYFV